MFCRPSMLLPQVSDKFVPSFRRWVTPHVFVNAWVCVGWDFFIQIRELELRVGDAESAECGVNSFEPHINVFRIERWQSRLLHLLH